jgi:predicted MFS family arabinose efflux permease
LIIGLDLRHAVDRELVATRLRDTLAREEREGAMAVQQSVWRTLANPIVLALSLVYFGIVAMNYSLNFFLPLIVKDFGLSNFQTGLVVAIPSIVGTVSMVFWGRRSDRQREHLSFALFVGTVCFVLTSAIQDPVLKMVFFSVAAFGIYAALPPVDIADLHALGSVSGGGNRHYQLARQSFGLHRAVCDGLGKDEHG